VQDLDYGWPVDRRGSVTIGNGPLYVHVKRSFQGHQLPSSGADRFPLEFRWAGKTYFIHTPDEVRIVNELLKATTESSAYTVATSFRNHQLFREAVQVDAQSGEHSLRRERTLTQVEVLSPDMRAGFMSPLGRIEWSHLYKSRASHFVPRQNLRVFVKDELMGWDSPGWYYDHELTANDPLAVPLVARRDRTRIKKFAETYPAESPTINAWFYWFGTSSDVPRKSVPSIVRLITAWADGQPDVPGAELLQLGGATSMEELWKRPPPLQSPKPVAYIEHSEDKPVEPKIEKPKPEFVPPAFLVPGSTPGTWRMKEPPEGVLAQ